MDKLSKQEVESQLDILMTWVTEQLDKGFVPKFSDVVDYAYRILKFTKLKKFQITKRLRLHPAYLMNSSQARRQFRGGKSRPILSNGPGFLHADLGFFSVTRLYETPVNYRAGFLVCRDILTRFIYVSVLIKNRTAPSIIRAFEDIFKQFRLQNNGMMVKSIGFDLERSVVGNKVQAIFKEKNVTFHGFTNTSSKAKFAENAIRQLRNTMERLSENSGERRWWHLIQPAVKALNHRPIEINRKHLVYQENSANHPYYTPADVNALNLKDFISKLQKANPSYYSAQFELDSRGVQFKFERGQFVRPKLLVISSEVIGTKRSEITLSNEIFIVKKPLLYVSRSHSVEKAYYCKSVVTGKFETFEEDEITETVGPII